MWQYGRAKFPINGNLTAFLHWALLFSSIFSNNILLSTAAVSSFDLQYLTSIQLGLVVTQGTVIIIANHGDRIDIPSGAMLENKIVSGNLRILDH